MAKKHLVDERQLRVAFGALALTALAVGCLLRLPSKRGEFDSLEENGSWNGGADERDLVEELLSWPPTSEGAALGGNRQGRARPLEYLTKVQNPDDCRQARLVRIRTSDGGGFGSKVQLFASRLVAALLANYTVVTDPASGMGGYTQGTRCQHSDHGGNDKVDLSGGGWTCIFEAVSACQAYVAALDPVERDARAPLFTDHAPTVWADAVPTPLRPGVDAMQWWAAVHAYIFRPNSATAAYLATTAKVLGWSSPHSTDGTTTSVPVRVGMHVRQGDKAKDFSGKISSFNHKPEMYLAELQQLLRHLVQRSATVLPQPAPRLAVDVFVATDSDDVKNMTRTAWPLALVNEFMTSLSIRILSAAANVSVALAADGSEVVRKLDSPAVSDLGYAAALEILADVHFLSQSHLYIGLCMSQPTRIAVCLGRARGTLVRNIALDAGAIDYVDYMKLGADEGWQARAAG